MDVVSYSKAAEVEDMLFKRVPNPIPSNAVFGDEKFTASLKSKIDNITDGNNIEFIFACGDASVTLNDISMIIDGGNANG